MADGPCLFAYSVLVVHPIAEALSSPSRLPRWLWPGAAMAVAFLPFVPGLSATHIFFVRDLTLFFWPRHLWIRDAMRHGRLPLWDPYSAGGQAVFPDALNQLFLPPVALLRLLMPAALGFNLIVALPLPLAALGAWLFARRHVAAQSAALGAIAFAASGSVLSTANFPNLSWSIAWAPWILWAVDRDLDAPSARRLATLAGLMALQVLSGEPVTLAGTIALAAAYALAQCRRAPAGRRGRITVRLAAAFAAAAAVSAVQLVPMVLAARHSPRAYLNDADFWSLHPLWTVEAVLPHVFGDAYTSYNRAVPWMPPLNSGREPFFFSIYIGPVVLLLALLGAVAGERRWRFFWLFVGAVGLLFGLGAHTPVYVALQAIVPGLRSFRFPAKFFLFASLAIAMLAAGGADVLLRRGGEAALPVGRGTARAMTVAVVTAGLLAAGLAGGVVLAPFAAARVFFEIGRAVGVTDPVAGAEFLFHSVPPAAVRVLALLTVGGVLLLVAWTRPRQAGGARLLLLVVVAADLVVVHAGLNPVLPASRFGAPAWTAEIANRPTRFYVGGKFRGSIFEADPDLALRGWHAPPGFNVIEGRAIVSTYLAVVPAPWHAREILSYDLPLLWPVEHLQAERMFEQADRGQRVRFLQRTGVQYCLAGTPMHPHDRLVARFDEPFATVSLYECVPDAKRVVVTDTAIVEPDHVAQLRQLFQERPGERAIPVMLDAEPPPPGGAPAAAGAAAARIVEDTATRVVVEAVAGEGGGYLVLRDTYDPDWRVQVDGEPTPMARADALFRAVRLAPGAHRVEFRYRPTAVYVWGACSALSVLLLAAFAALTGRPPAPSCQL